MSAIFLALLILIANGSPLLLALIWRGRPLPPVDGGLCLKDGQPLFGHHKSWPGLALSLAATALAGLLLGFGLALGLGLGLAAMAGDLFSSYCKRRSRLAPGTTVLVLDLLPECLLPAAFATWWLALSWEEFLLLPLLFLPISLALGHLLRILGLKPP